MALALLVERLRSITGDDGDDRSISEITGGMMFLQGTFIWGSG